MTHPNPAQLAQQISQIQRMERGKLTLMRQNPSGTHFKLQSWEKGKNFSRHISSDQAPIVQEAIEGYQKYRQLTEQYAQAVIEKTRAELAADSKKKIYRLRRKSSWPRTKKSNS